MCVILGRSFELLHLHGPTNCLWPLLHFLAFMTFSFDLHLLIPLVYWTPLLHIQRYPLVILALAHARFAWEEVSMIALPLDIALAVEVLELVRCAHVE